MTRQPLLLTPFVCLALAAGQGARAEDPAAPIPVPSGQTVIWLDTVRDVQGPAGLTLRFRFIADGIAGPDPDVTSYDAEADMQALCDTWALPRIASIGPIPAQIVIVLADRPVPFGETDPEATQFFGAFSVADGACVPELF